MMKHFKIVILIIFVSLINLGLQESENCRLSIELSNFRNNKGSLFIFVYNYKNQYPDNPFKYFEIDKSNLVNNRILVNLPELPKGKYAISLLDDENDNADLDRFLGIPTEGYGFSNNVRPLLSLPDFEDLLFDLTSQNQRLNLKMQYAL